MARALILQKNIQKLSLVLDPVVISTELYAKQLIDTRTWENARKESTLPNYDRCLKLMETLLRNIKASPSTFDTFCDILEQQDITARLAAELRDEIKQEDGQESGSKSIQNHIQGGVTSTKRKIQESSNNGSDSDKNRVTPCTTGNKQRIILKQGPIKGDKFLMEVAWDVGEKWEEVGIALDLDYKVLKSVIGSEVSTPDHTKAFHMLQEWKRRAADKFTYESLALALEESGLNSSAQKYCYSNCRENE